jgi:two-component system sensor histidine kinase TctE
VASRSPVDLGPIAAEDVPKEVQPLVIAINELLEKLKEDIEAQRRFVANAAHQLRTPIAGLKMQAELARRQLEPADMQHALSLIQTGAERAARLANQLLALARSEPGAIDPNQWQLIDINEVGREATKEFVPDAIARNIDLGFEKNEAVAMVWGDRASLHELAANLIDNAVRYTPEGGAVTVRIETRREHGLIAAQLSVEDNGPGIPEEEREHVFERFYRLLDRNVSGSGLGLAIVREIANVHRANVHVSEGANGQGTRFRIIFPPSDSLASTASAPQQSPMLAASSVD